MYYLKKKYFWIIFIRQHFDIVQNIIRKNFLCFIRFVFNIFIVRLYLKLRNYISLKTLIIYIFTVGKF